MSKKFLGLKTEDRRMRRARLIRDGMSWRQACLRSGYSFATANRGPRGYLNDKPGVQKDFARAAEEASYKPEFVKKAVTHRLMTAIIEGRSSEVAREAELLGKFREYDLFVRNRDANLGILMTLDLTADEVSTDDYDEK